MTTLVMGFKYYTKMGGHQHQYLPDTCIEKEEKFITKLDEHKNGEISTISVLRGDTLIYRIHVAGKVEQLHLTRRERV